MSNEHPDEDAPPPSRKHYYTGYIIMMGENGYKYEPHRFIVRAENEYEGASLIRAEMGLKDRDAIYFDQQIGFDDE